LLLASVITLLTLNVGIFEQRTSGNDARAKLIAEVAESGIAQGAEFFRLQPALLKPSGNWVRCVDDTFPCGSISDTARRNTMYFWQNAAGGVDVNNDSLTDVLDRRMLPLANVVPAAGRVSAVGNFNTVSYGVGVVLCRIKTPDDPADPTECSTNPATQSGTFVYNYVSVAALPGEGTRTTVSQMLGQYQIFNPNLNQPPIMASGSVDVTGGLQIVTNPNGGGSDGRRSRLGVDAPRHHQDRYAEHLLHRRILPVRRQEHAPPTLEENVPVCDTCGCPTDSSLSYDKSGNKQDEGMDILDIDGSNGANNLGINADVVPSEFPCDLFEYVFGLKARQDNDGDFFCETLVPSVQFTSPTTMTQVWLDADEAYSVQERHQDHPARRQCGLPDEAEPGAGGRLSGVEHLRHRLVPDQLRPRREHADRYAEQAGAPRDRRRRTHPGSRLRHGLPAHGAGDRGLHRSTPRTITRATSSTPTRAARRRST
jgi:hypothetical protein